MRQTLTLVLVAGGAGRARRAEPGRLWPSLDEGLGPPGLCESERPPVLGDVLEEARAVRGVADPVRLGEQARPRRDDGRARGGVVTDGLEALGVHET
jgi:hypothetical protein